QESSFNAEAGKNKHQARGLMQVQPNAIRQVYAVRLKKKLGRTPTDVEKKKAFDDADVDYAKGVLFDEAKNIQIGTEYIQYWLDKSNGDIAKAYVGYRGPDEPTYYSRIKTTADKLRADPNSVKPLLEMKDLP
ncbi:MAG: transglycosylase SLT domain-containing protein, partial [Lysobacter sp.]|nr:transglycosylase SLT domain-containing protein [Lysobacter sp.]